MKITSSTFTTSRKERETSKATVKPDPSNISKDFLNVQEPDSGRAVTDFEGRIENDSTEKETTESESTDDDTSEDEE